MANIKIKLGNLELACEGEEAFLKTEIPNFLKVVSEFYQQAPREIVAPASAPAIPVANGNGHQEPLEMSANNIATKLGAGSGADLTLAACVSLALVKRLATFSREQILEEMQEATNYYKRSHGANLSNQLKTLVRTNKLIERSPGNFALSAPTKTDTEARLVATN